MLEPSPSGPIIKTYLKDLQHLKSQRVIHERASPKTNWLTDRNRWTRIKTDKSFVGLILYTFAANPHSSLQATPLDIGCCL